MANYTRTQNFTVKDSLDTGDAEKIISGTDVDGELNAIAIAIASKAESSFEAGVKMVFIGASAPSGWSLVTTYDDKVLIIQNAAGESTGGNWSVNAAGNAPALKATSTGNVPITIRTIPEAIRTLLQRTPIIIILQWVTQQDQRIRGGLSPTNNVADTTFFATGNYTSANLGRVNGNVPLDFASAGNVVGSGTLTTSVPSNSNTGDPNTTVAITMATALSGTMVSGTYRPSYVNSFICSKN
jgi:hypothetical protein